MDELDWSEVRINFRPSISLEDTNNMKHIRDCWNALEACTTIEEVNETIANFPNKFGSWSVDFEDGQVVVYNSYYDEVTDNYEEDYLYLDIAASDPEMDSDDLI